MTEGYKALLTMLDRPPVNVDKVRQRLTGQVGVNPGDRMCFTMELLHDMVSTSRGSDPKWHTIDVVLRDVRVLENGSKVLVIDVVMQDIDKNGLVRDVAITRVTNQRPFDKGFMSMHGIVSGCVA